jgi:tRNA pseudouridine32 synthase/23S rRNA pseudouridine746 synthase
VSQLHLFKEGVGASRVFCPKSPVFDTLFTFLCAKYPAILAKTWQYRFNNADIYDSSGMPFVLNSPYPAGHTVYYFREVEQEVKLPYYETIIYQDDSLIIADKPHFLPVIPSGKYVKETLLVRLKQRLNLPHLVPLHRIDRDTAGLVMFGVQPKQRGAYQNLFRDRLIDKTYLALAAYEPIIADYLMHTNTPYIIKSYLNGSHTKTNKKINCLKNFMQVSLNEGAGTVPTTINIPNTQTEIVAVQRLEKYPEMAQYTLKPLTGKRHQLRVHMLKLGLPIIGDEIYPVLMPERDISQLGHPPLQLLAKSIAFIDPITQQPRYFESTRNLDYFG